MKKVSAKNFQEQVVGFFFSSAIIVILKLHHVGLCLIKILIISGSVNMLKDYVVI